MTTSVPHNIYAVAPLDKLYNIPIIVGCVLLVILSIVIINLLIKWTDCIKSRDANYKLSNDSKMIHNVRLLSTIINAQITKSATTCMLSAQIEYKKKSINTITIDEFRTIVEQTTRDAIANFPSIIISDLFGNYFSELQLFLIAYNECVIQNNGFFTIKPNESTANSSTEGK